ncbi:lamin tail domain-containing protein [Patescibacteria group bacterium]
MKKGLTKLALVIFLSGFLIPGLGQAEPEEFTVRLNELLPNPEGTDSEGEFIELYNYGNQTVNLFGYQLDDEEGGSNPYHFPEETTIEPEGFLVVYRTESKITLNNTQDQARILDLDNEVVEEIDYEGGKEGWSYSYSDENWDWTDLITPGETNEINGDVLGDEDEYQEATIKKAKTLSDRTKVSVTGTLTVEPGVFSDKYCYFQDGNEGLMVYFSKSDFPTLKVGDKIRAQGKMSTAMGERKLNLTEKSDIEKIGVGKIEPEIIKTGDSENDEYTGRLITVQGKVARSSGKTFYLDDGSGECKISIQESTGIKKPETKKGTSLLITGVVNKTTSGNRLLPRYQTDFHDKLVDAGLDLKIYLVIGLWLFVILNCLVLVLKS